MYSDDEAAALYDALYPQRQDYDFYLPLVMDAASVLDVGCGTGTLLHRARNMGHTGRLCGVDPDRAMLARARRRSDIEWVEATASSMVWDREFDLAIMTGHAFQTLIGDDEINRSLAAIRRARAPGSHFAFETRNPGVRAWEGWTPAHAREVVGPASRLVRISHEVEAVNGDIVTFTETTSDANGTALRVDRANLRFLDAAALSGFLTDAGFAIEAQYGGWLRESFAPLSPEIITIARIADRPASM